MRTWRCASRVALPERSSRFGWLIPQFAAIAAFAIAAVVWTMRDPATPSLLPSSDVVAVMAVPNTVAAARTRNRIVEPCPWNAWNPWNLWNLWMVITNVPSRPSKR